MKQIQWEIIALFGLLIFEWVIPHPFPMNTNALIIIVGMFILMEIQELGDK